MYATDTGIRHPDEDEVHHCTLGYATGSFLPPLFTRVGCEAYFRYYNP